MHGWYSPVARKNCQQDSSLTGQQFKIETGIVRGIVVLQQNICIHNHNITGCRRSGIKCPFHHFLNEGMVGEDRYTWNMYEITQGTLICSDYTQKLWEPRLGGPERCHQHPCGTILLNLCQDSSQDAKGRESVKLESSPTKGEGIHCPCPRFRFPGHKWCKLAVQSACKEVNLWNKGEGRKQTDEAVGRKLKPISQKKLTEIIISKER